MFPVQVYLCLSTVFVPFLLCLCLPHCFARYPSTVHALGAEDFCPPPFPSLPSAPLSVSHYCSGLGQEGIAPLGRPLLSSGALTCTLAASVVESSVSTAKSTST